MELYDFKQLHFMLQLWDEMDDILWKTPSIVSNHYIQLQIESVKNRKFNFFISASHIRATVLYYMAYMITRWPTTSLNKK